MAAAVVLPDRFRHPLLRDSKLLSEQQRETIEPVIRREAISVAIVAIEVAAIDKRGLGWANRVAFQRLIESVEAPAYLVDGNLTIATGRRYLSVVGGDRLVPAISAASIVAKVYRDHLMRGLHPMFPHYAWDQNKGYGTPHHLGAISRHGTCCHHRTSFTHPQQPGLFDRAAGSPG